MAIEVLINEAEKFPFESGKYSCSSILSAKGDSNKSDDNSTIFYVDTQSKPIAIKIEAQISVLGKTVSNLSLKNASCKYSDADGMKKLVLSGYGNIETEHKFPFHFNLYNIKLIEKQ